jgi:hypothetical protein
VPVYIWDWPIGLEYNNDVIITSSNHNLSERCLSLQDWLIGRVADDNDVIIDDLQSELAGQLDEEDETMGIKVKLILFCS